MTTINLFPRFLISSAISIAMGFLPELEIRKKTSLGWMDTLCMSVRPTPACCSYMPPAGSKISFDGINPPARPLISSAAAWECPLPKACVIPPFIIPSATIWAAFVIFSVSYFSNVSVNFLHSSKNASVIRLSPFYDYSSFS